MTNKNYSELAISQFESLRQEILQKINESGTTIRFGIISSGAIWTWLATNKKITVGFEFTVWIPMLLVILLAFMYWCIRSDIKILSQKIAQIEKDFELSPELCWESNWSEGVSKTIFASWAIWCILLIGNATFAIINV